MQFLTKSTCALPSINKFYLKLLCLICLSFSVFVLFQICSNIHIYLHTKMRRNTKDSFQNGDNKESMDNRRNQVLATCLKYPDLPKVLRTSKWLVSRRHNLLYCPVEKVASTFWRRFLHQLEYTSLMKSPFDVNVREMYATVDKNTSVYERDDRLAHLMQTSTKLLFVRDPYSRLFSAYVDKLLAPNPIFWRNWGAEAVRKFRSSTSVAGSTKTASGTCGDDVSFSEFISLATSPRGQADHHVMSINRLCSPCHVNYTVIGKMETFLEDTRLLLRRLGVDEVRLELHRMPEDVRRDAVEDSVLDPLSKSWLDRSLKCVSKDDILKRIWRKLQIRGFISWRVSYQMAPEIVLNISGLALVDHLRTAIEASTNRTELSVQKTQALLEAYATVTDEQFDSVRSIYDIDFKLFNYDAEPEALSRSRLSRVKDTGAFDWRKNWDLTPAL